MRPRHRLLIIVLPLLAASCRGPGPEVERLEAALVVVADIDDLDTGDRFRFYREDSSTTFFRNQRSGFHSQLFRAGDGAGPETRYSDE